MWYLTGIIITFFLSFILLSKRNKTGADKILSLWLPFIGLHLLFFYLNSTDLTFFPVLLGIAIPFPLIHGPFLYLYTASLTNQSSGKWMNLLHFVPAVLTYFSLIPFYALGVEEKIEVYQTGGKGFETLTGFIMAAIIFSGIAYVILSLWTLKKFRRAAKNEFSYTENINLTWLRYLIFGIGVIWVSVIFGTDSTTYSSVVLFVLFIGYFGIKQVGIFTQAPPSEEIMDTAGIVSGLKEIAPENFSFAFKERMTEEKKENMAALVNQHSAEKIKYQKSGLNDSSAEKIHEKLKLQMQTEKWYRDPELSLSQLAQKLNIQTNILSQVINSYENRTFYDYINQLRIEEFKKMVILPENQKYTLLSLAFDCGYNSKTSFNRNFKKVTSLSPSEYLKRADISLS